MEARVVKLRFRGPVHFGGGRLSDGGFACDAATLFSALYIEARAMGVADELLEAARAGVCSLSDAFPYQGGTLYLPKPNIVSNDGARGRSAGLQQDSRARKANKQLKYIPVDKLADYARGSFDAVAEAQRFDVGVSFVRTQVNLLRETSDDAEPFHVGGFAFAQGCGIYFLTCGGYDLRPLLDRLRYAGIGGKRSSGYGAFDYEMAECALRVGSGSVAAGGRALLLASAAPRREELTGELLDGARYLLDRKGGFVQSGAHAATPRKKRNLWTFRPGSVFVHTFEGDIFDVNDTPGAHPVYRYARAMWMEV